MPGDETRSGAAPVPDEAEESVSFETPDIYGAYPRLSDDQMARLAQHGKRHAVDAGDVLIREGSGARRFTSSSVVRSPSSRATVRPTNTCYACTTPAASSANSAS